MIESQEEIDAEFAKNVQAVQDSKENLNKIIEIKNKIEELKYKYYKTVKDVVIKPKELY